MGKVIRGCRKGKGSVFRSHTVGRKGAVGMKKADYAERHGYVKGVVKDIIHDKGRGAPVAKIQFKDPYRFKRVNTLIVAPEGMHTGQFIYAGKKAELEIGNILPVGQIPEGTVICNIEAKVGDCGKMARASGDYAIIVAQDADKGVTRIRLPSGSKKTISAACRAMLGLCAGGGRTDKPILKVGFSLSSSLLSFLMPHFFFWIVHSPLSFLCFFFGVVPHITTTHHRPGVPSTSTRPSATSGPRSAVWR
jgi:large subunit ribosomal protein L8e